MPGPPPPDSAAVAVAARFARALDLEDYAAASRCLDPNCVYQLRGERVVGVEATIESYRSNGDAAALTFDKIDYASEVRDAGDGWAVIRFRDLITHRGEQHEHACDQRVHITGTGLIDRIEHRDLPDEREKLAAFRTRLGI